MPRPTRRRVLFFVPVAVLSPLLAVGCAAGSGGNDAQTVMISAAARSEAASTFHVSASEQMRPLKGNPFPQLSGVTAEGDVDLATGRLRMEATLIGKQPGTGTAPQTLSFSVIQIGSESWSSSSGLGGPAPAGRWVQDNASLPATQLPDPGKLFAALKSRAAKVRSVGTATIDGVATQQYQLLGPPSLLNALGGGSSDQSLAAGPVSIQVWVDKSHLVRRLSTALEENLGGPGQVEAVAITVNFTRYGEAVHIEAPLPSLVVPAS